MENEPTIFANYYDIFNYYPRSDETCINVDAAS